MPQPGDRTRVLVGDRPGPARSALAYALTALPGVAVLGVEGDGASLSHAVEEVRPDVVVIDERLLDEWQERDDVGLIVVGTDDDPGCAERAARVGAVARLPKACAGDRLAAALRAAAAPLSRLA